MLKNKIPSNSEIKFIRSTNSDSIMDLSPSGVTYYLDIPQNANDLDFFSHRLSGSSRRKLQQKMRNIEIAGVKGQIVDYDVSELIEQYSNQHFGEESTFKSIDFRAVLSGLNNSKFDVQNLVFTLEGSIVGVALAVVYNNIFYALSVGYTPEVKDLGKYINYFEIGFAHKLGAKRINFFADDCGWKENWKLQKDDLYRFDPNNPQILEMQNTGELSFINTIAT